MSIEIRSQNFSVTSAIREHTERSLRFALDGYAVDRLRDVRQLVVRLGDINGPKGGGDKFCLITAQVGLDTVVAEDVHSNLDSAISRATLRFSLKAARELAREKRLMAIYRAEAVVEARRS